MLRPKRLNLLLVRSDGAGLVRVNLPMWAVVTALGGAALVVALAAISVGAFYEDYVTLRRARESTASLLPRLVEQQAVLDLYQRRVREVRAEIDSWRVLHAKIWEPFGPDAGPANRMAGIGGGTATGAFEAPAERADVREELTRLSRRVEEEGENLRALERFLSRAGKLLASLPSRWPLRGPVNSEFGRRLSPWIAASEFHSGIDIGAPVGTAVHAPAPGTIVFAGHQPEYGITLLIDHGNATTSLYGHLSRLNVGVSNKVERGVVVAWSGNTGRSSGPHLHYEIQVKGQPVDPFSYIWE